MNLIIPYEDGDEDECLWISKWGYILICISRQTPQQKIYSSIRDKLTSEKKSSSEIGLIHSYQKAKTKHILNPS